MKKKISILGSTGSIGRQALEVIEKISDKFEIIALAAGGNTDLLNEQIRKFKPKYAYASKPELVEGAKYQTLEEICSNKENDIILVAVSGKIGLKPTIIAINNGIDIALANKETLVMAGDIVMPLAKEKGVNIIPVDSEHCAIHQCIKDIAQVDKLIITASGGPFLRKSVEEMKQKIAEGKIDETLDMMPCEAGDYTYVVGGTLHAATAGSLHFEIEENSEYTYRFYDFDRIDKNGNKRPLQLEKALACLDVTKKSKAGKYGDEPIVERMYSTQLIKGRDTFTNTGDMFAFAVMLRGEKMIDGIRVMPGTAILLDENETLDVSGCEFMIAKPLRG